MMTCQQFPRIWYVSLFASVWSRSLSFWRAGLWSAAKTVVWARGGEGALASCRTPHGYDQTSGIFSILSKFSTCGSRKSSKMRLATELSRNCRKSHFARPAAAASREKRKKWTYQMHIKQENAFLGKIQKVDLRPPQVRKIGKKWNFWFAKSACQKSISVTILTSTAWRSWVCGGEGALAELLRATRSRPNFGRFVFHSVFFHFFYLRQPHVAQNIELRR